jgi:hypothetical protein
MAALHARAARRRRVARGPTPRAARPGRESDLHAQPTLPQQVRSGSSLPPLPVQAQRRSAPAWSSVASVVGPRLGARTVDAVRGLAWPHPRHQRQHRCPHRAELRVGHSVRPTRSGVRWTPDHPRGQQPEWRRPGSEGELCSGPGSSDDLAEHRWRHHLAVRRCLGHGSRRNRRGRHAGVEWHNVGHPGRRRRRGRPHVERSRHHPVLPATHRGAEGRRGSTVESRVHRSGRDRADEDHHGVRRVRARPGRRRPPRCSTQP